MDNLEPSPDTYIDWGYKVSARGCVWRIVQVPGQPWLYMRYDQHGRFLYAYPIAIDSFGDFR